MIGASTEKLIQASQVASKLELARDSLEIIRKATSKISFDERRASAVGTLDEFRKTTLSYLGKKNVYVAF